MFDVRAYSWKWILVGVMAAAPVGAEVIFEENFDAQVDYIGEKHLNGGNSLWAESGDVVPEGWTAISLWPKYSESYMEIVSSNKDKARGETGKSLVLRRGSFSGSWSGDSQLALNLPKDYDEVYVRFWIKFQPKWTHDGYSKIFRIGSYPPNTRGSDYWSRIGMGFIWDYVHFSESGLRNSLFATPLGGGSFKNPPLGYTSNNFNGQGWNSNYTSFTYDLDGDVIKDNEPELLNRVDGGVIPDSGLIATHDHVFGDAWNELEFYVRINSRPGAQDGVLMQWLNGSLIFKNTSIPWVPYDAEMVGFNAVKFGGNDYFMAYPDSQQVQEWYAIDDIVIRSSLPDGEIKTAPPEPPNSILVR